MAPYKVAIVGTGMVANVGHIPAWLELAPAVEVVGVFNHTLAKAQQTADRHGIPRWSSALCMSVSLGSIAWTTRIRSSNRAFSHIVRVV